MKKSFLKIFFSILIKITPLAAVTEIGYEVYQMNQKEDVMIVEYAKNYIVDAKLYEDQSTNTPQKVLKKLRRVGMNVTLDQVTFILEDLRVNRD